MSVLFLIVISVFAVFGQTDFWPEVLTAPLTEEPADSNKVEIMAVQDLRMDIYQTNNSISLLRNDSLKEVEQICHYELFNDHNLGIQNHYLDLSGSISRKNFPFKFSSLGMEWVPNAVLNRRKNSSNAIGSMRIGPTIGIDYLNMPIRLSGGGAVDVWHNELPHEPGFDDLTEAEEDPGFYGGISVGDNRKPLIERIPFYAEGSIFGRYMKSGNNSKITNGEVNALFYRDVVFADTFFIYCADTLLIGRTAFLSEQEGGSAKYSSTPDRTNNSLQATCGLKDIGTFFLKPSVTYRWRLFSVTYPLYEEIIGDERLISHTIAFMIKNEASRIINYNGGISFAFENEDWLFKDFKDTLPIEATEDNKDSLVENLKDYEGFYAQMYHTIGKRFKNNFEFVYSFDINRYRKIYPNFYTVGRDTTRTNNDKDNVDHTHSLDVTLFSSPRMKLAVFGEYTRNETVYLRKERSARNKTGRIYRLETSLYINPEDSTGLKETIGAFAKNEEYHFPEFNNDPPQLLRKFYSKLYGGWEINDHLMFEGSWNEIYSDDGYWSESEYRNTKDSNDDNSYYAIESKSVESSIELIGSYQFFNNFTVRIGSLFQYIYYREWDYNEEKYNKHNIYYLIPFIEMNAQLFDRAFVNARIERYMDPNADDYWEAVSLINVIF